MLAADQRHGDVEGRGQQVASRSVVNWSGGRPAGEVGGGCRRGAVNASAGSRSTAAACAGGGMVTGFGHGGA